MADRRIGDWRLAIDGLAIGDWVETMKIKTTKDRRTRIALRQRKRIAGTTERPRLRVFRSVSHIYAQVIDDLSGSTLAAASSAEPSLKGTFAGTVRGGNVEG